MFAAAEGGLILNVLDSGRLGLTKYPPGLNCCVAFKGYDNWKDKDIPIRLYIVVHYSTITATALPSLVSYDIDSICAFGTLLAAVC